MGYGFRALQDQAGFDRAPGGGRGDGERYDRRAQSEDQQDHDAEGPLAEAGDGSF
jgi:hypothetical protein